MLKKKSGEEGILRVKTEWTKMCFRGVFGWNQGFTVLCIFYQKYSCFIKNEKKLKKINNENNNNKKRIRLPMQGTRVRALVQEDPTCCRATKPVCYNYWACALEPTNHSYWAREPQLLSPRATTTEARTPRARAVLRNKRSHCNEKSAHRNGE